VNQRIEPPRDTIRNPSTDNEVLLRDIAVRGAAVFAGVSETTTMCPEDRADALGCLLDELDTERARIVSARAQSYRLAELETLLEGAAK
jgi:hypothetical protein